MFFAHVLYINAEDRNRLRAEVDRLYTDQALVCLESMERMDDLGLVNFRSLAQKTQLLEAASQFGCPDSLLRVILFLHDTLSLPIFQTVLSRNQVASDAYRQYLRQAGKLQDLEKYYQDTGQRRECAFMLVRASWKKRGV